MRFTVAKPFKSFTVAVLLAVSLAAQAKLPDGGRASPGQASVKVSNNGVHNFLRELFRCREQMTGAALASESSKTDFLNKCLGPYAIQSASNSLQDCSARLLKLAEAKGLAEVDMNLSFRYLSMCRKSKTLQIDPGPTTEGTAVEL
jgi:hypothetical protein